MARRPSLDAAWSHFIFSQASYLSGLFDSVEEPKSWNFLLPTWHEYSSREKKNKQNKTKCLDPSLRLVNKRKEGKGTPLTFRFTPHRRFRVFFHFRFIQIGYRVYIPPSILPLAFVMGACSSFSSFFSPLPFRGCTLLIGNTARREIQLVALHTHASLTLRRPPRRWFIYSVDEKGATKSQHCRKAETRPIHFKSEIKKKVPAESVGDDVRTIQLESAVSETKSLVLFIPFDWAAGPILSLSLSLEADGVSQERTWHREFRCRLLCRKRERERNESQRYPHPWLLAQYTDRAQQLQSLRFRIPSAYGLHLRAAFNQSLISHTLLRREARTHLERWIIERRWPTARARRPSATPIGSSK